MTNEKDTNFLKKRAVWLKIIWIGWFIVGFIIGLGIYFNEGTGIWSGLGMGAMVWWLWLLWFGLTLWTNKTEKRLNVASIVWIIVAVLVAILYIASA